VDVGSEGAYEGDAGSASTWCVEPGSWSDLGGSAGVARKKGDEESWVSTGWGKWGKCGADDVCGSDGDWGTGTFQGTCSSASQVNTKHGRDGVLQTYVYDL